MALNKFSFLELTNYPVTNQEVEIFKSASWFRQNASNSHFYMIVSRPQISFKAIESNELNAIDGMQSFEVSSGAALKDTFILRSEEVPEVKALEEGAPYILGREGPVLVLCKKRNPQVNSDVYRDWTIQKLIWERSRNSPWILGLNKFREFQTFNLLYVGIAPASDTLNRLIEGAHHARQKILSNEYPIEYGTRVTDEVSVLMFEINPLFIQDLKDDADVLNPLFIEGYEDSPIIKDAEKAFISLLNPKYNTQMYRSYPAGKDGMYDAGFDGYSYSIAENITLNSPTGPFMGARDNSGILFSNKADSIYVTGDNVEVINFRD